VYSEKIKKIDINFCFVHNIPVDLRKGVNARTGAASFFHAGTAPT
jgi:hypothetical protein